MITLRPFRAWRPPADKASLVGSRSYVSYTPAQLAERLAGNPYSFLHVIHPDPPGQDMPRQERFAHIRAAFRGFCEQGIMVRDGAPSLYLYEQSARGNVSRGLIAAVSVADYRAGLIKVHEQTLTARESLFADYLGSTGINAEPVLLATPEGTVWEASLDPLLATRAEQDFTTTDRVRHRLWSITDAALIHSLQRSFASIPALYIADGHHRLASSARLAETRNAGEEDPASWCLAYIVPRNHLYMFNFDRTVTTLNGHDERSFLEALGQLGRLERVGAPWSAPGVVAVRTASGWHVLHMPAPPPAASPADRLDAARLSELILGPVLGITDLRTDPRVGFVPGTQGTTALDGLVDRGEAAAAFHLSPVRFAELQAVADAGCTMPPKSTYIEPKLRSGLVVYDLDVR